MNGINNIRFGSYYVLPERGELEKNHGSNYGGEMARTVEKTANIPNFWSVADIGSTGPISNKYTIDTNIDGIGDKPVDEHIETYLQKKGIEFQKYRSKYEV